MGFRLQRSLKIAKGVRLNVSKSGLGISVGPKGLGISAGPRGIYGHAGIPGTGLSVRNKLGSIDSGNNLNQDLNTGGNSRSIEVSISIDDETGKETIKLMEGSEEIHDESILRKIKKDPAFKEKLQAVREQVFNETQEKTAVIINIHKYSQKLTDWKKIAKDVKTATPTKYIRIEFTQKKPNRERVYGDLVAEANRNIRTVFGRKKKRKEYVNKRLDRAFLQEMEKWNKEKIVHEAM